MTRFVLIIIISIVKLILFSNLGTIGQLLLRIQNSCKMTIIIENWLCNHVTYPMLSRSRMYVLEINNNVICLNYNCMLLRRYY
jgi:hypothetical protein